MARAQWDAILATRLLASTSSASGTCVSQPEAACRSIAAADSFARVILALCSSVPALLVHVMRRCCLVPVPSAVMFCYDPALLSTALIFCHSRLCGLLCGLPVLSYAVLLSRVSVTWHCLGLLFPTFDLRSSPIVPFYSAALALASASSSGRWLRIWQTRVSQPEVARRSSTAPDTALGERSAASDDRRKSAARVFTLPRKGEEHQSGMSGARAGLVFSRCYRPMSNAMCNGKSF